MKLPLLDGVRGDAILSPDRTYRYLLTRDWNQGGTGKGSMNSVLWIMLNPSVGDAADDDRTLRRCQQFSRSWGYDGLAVVNLFALRSSDPSRLRSHPDPVGHDNDMVIASLMAPACEAVKLVVAAWGRHGSTRFRDARVIDLARKCGRDLHALVLNDDGSPKHPLYCTGGLTEPIMYRRRDVP